MHHQEINSVSTSLVVGADSGIGERLIAEMTRKGQMVVGTTRRDSYATQKYIRLDLCCDPSGWRLPLNINVAYLCAAVTSLERCHVYPDQTALINVERTCSLARMLVEQGAFVVFLSTNLVYDGRTPFRSAQDLVCPTTEYGRQKAEAEHYLLALGESVAVVRLTKVLTLDAPLLRAWYNDLTQGRIIAPFSDMFIAPLPLSFVCLALLLIGEQHLNGIIQLSGSRDLSYAEAAMIGARMIGADPNLIRPISATGSGKIKEVPALHTTLDTTRINNELEIIAPPVERTIADIFAAQMHLHSAPTTME